jgi:hypothetical protein
LEKNGMIFVGQSEDGNRMEIMELRGHPYFVGVQYHPEYLSRPTKPSAPYLGFMLAACSKLAMLVDKMKQSKLPLVSIRPNIESQLNLVEMNKGNSLKLSDEKSKAEKYVS